MEVLNAREAITRPGQRMQKMPKLLERALIHHYVAEAHDVVDQQGVRTRRHEIVSEGPIPRSMDGSSNGPALGAESDTHPGWSVHAGCWALLVHPGR